MNNQVKVYQIKDNSKIKQGTIYTLYLNNNTNLDISNILNTKSLQLQELITNNMKQQETITISNQDYTRILELNNLLYQLTTKRSKDIQEFIQKETNTTTELTKINNERQELIKRLTKKGGTNAT